VQGGVEQGNGRVPWFAAGQIGKSPEDAGGADAVQGDDVVFWQGQPVDLHAGESAARAPWAGVGQFWFVGPNSGDGQQGQAMQVCGSAVTGSQVWA